MASEDLYVFCKSCGNTVLKKYSHCSHCGSKIKRFAWGKVGLFLLVSLVLLAILSPSKKSKEKLSNFPHIEAKSKNLTPIFKNEFIEKISVAPPIPIDQKRFVETVSKFISDYGNAKNEIQQSLLRDLRKESISRVLSGSSIQNWVGQVSNLETNSAGDAIFGVSIFNNISIKTWNNSLSDIGSNTMIKKGSNLYNKLLDLSKGDWVAFSGNFIPSNEDHIRETSVTIDGSMTNPDFLFSFFDVVQIETGEK